MLIAAFAPPLAEVALKFGPAEYFSLMVLGLIAAVVLASGSLIKAIGMIVLGLLLGLVGTDVNSGVAALLVRHARSCPTASASSRSRWACSASPRSSSTSSRRKQREVFTEQGRRAVAEQGRVQGRVPGVDCAARCSARRSASCRAAARCCRAFASYTLEKKIAGPNADPRSARATSSGVAGPESANNAGAQTSFIPLLTLGIPPNAVMALMVGAMTIHNIQPGPQVMTSNPELFWGLIASMWVGNLMLVVLNLPLIGMWVKLLKVPYRLLYPAILVFCCIGVYSHQQHLVRRLRDGRSSACSATCSYKLELRAGAAAPGLHPRPDDGGEPAPRACCCRAATRRPS